MPTLFLTKPFHLEELVARVNAKLRKPTHHSAALTFADLSLSPKNSTLTCTATGREVEIVGKEFYVLECLLKSPKNIVAKQFIYDNVWGMDNDFSSNNLEAYISFIRRKLESIGSAVKIKAIRGLGYKLDQAA